MTNTNTSKAKVDYLEKLSVAMEAFNEILSDANSLNQKLVEINQEQQDILHIIETVSFNASQGFTLAKRLQEIRIERRDIKNRIEELKKIESTVKHFDISFKSNISTSIANISKERKIAQNRTYRLRRLTDLQPYNELAKKQKEKSKQVV